LVSGGGFSRLEFFFFFFLFPQHTAVNEG